MRVFALTCFSSGQRNS